MLHSYAYGTVVLKVSSLILRTREKAAGVKVWAPNWRKARLRYTGLETWTRKPELGNLSSETRARKLGLGNSGLETIFDTVSELSYEGKQNCWLEAIDSDIVKVMNSCGLANLTALIWGCGLNLSSKKMRQPLRGLRLQWVDRVALQLTRSKFVTWVSVGAWEFSTPMSLLSVFFLPLGVAMVLMRKSMPCRKVAWGLPASVVSAYLLFVAGIWWEKGEVWSLVMLGQ